MALASSLDEITLGLRQLLERIENTIIVARSDAYGHTLITYDRSKKSAEQGLAALTRDLCQRFARKPPAVFCSLWHFKITHRWVPTSSMEIKNHSPLSADSINGD